jgi:hypothetical protein
MSVCSYAVCLYVVCWYAVYTHTHTHTHTLSHTHTHPQWTAFDLHHYSNISQWLGFKINILLYSIGAFFILSTVTGRYI